MAPTRVGPFSLDKARQTYEDLGPLTQSDVYRLLAKSDKKRQEMLQRIYGRYGAEYAMIEFKRMLNAL